MTCLTLASQKDKDKKVICKLFYKWWRATLTEQINLFWNLINNNGCLFCSKLAGKTLFISGASRGIGKAIALKAARDGANVIIAAKTAEPHPVLPGTIFTAAQEGR